MIKDWRPRKPPQLVRWDLLGVLASYMWGNLNSLPLPPLVRSSLYYAWSIAFRVNLDEVPESLESYATLRDFFSRSIKEGVRPIVDQGMASPVDGKVIVFGEVENDRVEQVKGVTYPIAGFLGNHPKEFKMHEKTKLFHCVLYLAPGDYHRIHSPVDWNIERSRHFPGTLFPISPVFGRMIPNLFALNERIVCSGTWDQGFYSLAAVGAYNVGSISLNFDETVRTNNIGRDFTCGNLRYFSFGGVGSQVYENTYEENVQMKKGEELGKFNLGSTVVLIFEANENFQFTVQPGDKVKMGQQMGVWN
eukprot:TRINITY_DN390_c0_g1_i2.p1 TRINITY_DN390_c0_g1~~TRINITY_DN390_c0_g1_i2.p1  ORF type:complete len:305 (+),score=79.26 TRINITY_DN390_c0_g1_i2:165-1079(+)